MNDKDKELLLKDLCGRLPYGVKISKVIDNFISEPHQIRSINLNNIIIEDGEFEDGTPDIDVWDIENIKPYLFPLSSMTEEQREELNKITNGSVSISESFFYDLYNCSKISTGDIIDVIDWLNKNHIDYRGLIKKELAIDCTNLNIY